MAKQGKRNAYGAPAEEKELVISLDRRLFIGLGILVVFGGAVAFGMWSARGGGSPSTATTASNGSVSAPMAPAVATAQMEAELKSLNLNPDTTTIIGQGGGAEMQPLDPNQVQPPSNAGAMMNAPETTDGSRDIIQPNANADVPEGMAELGGEAFEVNQDPNRPNTENWDHEVLANFEDPNVTNQDYAPVRTEDVEGQQLDGPRLGISDLNTINTYDFGLAPMTEPVSHNFLATNVGDEDLLISRVYTGCGCTATRLANVVLDAAGWVVDDSGEQAPFVLAPGESAEFTVEFDPRAEGKPGAMSKYIQIFSNDPTKVAFDSADPNSHETRFRIVVEPSYAYDGAAVEDEG